MGFWPSWNRYNIIPLKRGGFPTFATKNSFIDIIHSTENKAIKENSNYKSSYVASNSKVIWHNVDYRRVYMKS